MSKKKNSTKKHKFKHADPSAPLQSTAVSSASAPVEGPRVSGAAQSGAVSGRDFSYVVGDVRRIGIMAGVLVALELLFYYLLVFTSVGPAVYRMVDV